MLPLVTLVAAIIIALTHLTAGNLRALQGYPRSIWLSVAGGISVAYVFIHLLPEVSASQEVIGSSVGELLGYLDRHVYLIALIGLTVFYGLESAARSSRRSRRHWEGADTTSHNVFWLHIGSFSLYNVLIGYLLLHRLEEGFTSLVLFVAAMTVHFVVNDYGLTEHHKDGYRSTGRWVLAAAILAGWFLSLVGDVPEEGIAILIAFLGGSVVLNVLKEELPEERASRFWPFVLGATAYAAILLAI